MAKVIQTLHCMPENATNLFTFNFGLNLQSWIRTLQCSNGVL